MIVLQLTPSPIDIEANGHTGEHLAHVTSPGSFAPLLVPTPLTHSGLRQKLHDGFQTAVEGGIRDAAFYHQTMLAKTNRYQRVLSLVKNACGICIMQQPSQVVEHGPWMCPHRGNHAEFTKFRRSIVYLKDYGSDGVCWKCHLGSFKREYIHPPFTQPPSCPNPNFMLGVLWETWSNELLRDRASSALGVKWTSAEDYARWLVTRHPQHICNSMLLLLWVGNVVYNFSEPF